MRRHRFVSAVAAVLALLSAACGDDDRTAATTTSSETTEPPETTDTSTTTTSEPSEDRTPPMVLAADQGVTVADADGETITVSDRPAAAAFALRADLVAFQDALETGRGYPPSPDGPVRVWSAGDARALPMGPDARRVALLDVAVVDGAPVALVSERIGEVGPGDTFEELVLIDLDDDSRTTAVRRPAWESGYAAARVLPDGDIVGLMTAEAHLVLNRWSPGAEDVDWTVDLGIDVSPALAVRDAEVSVVDYRFREDRGSILTVTAHDPATGEAGERQDVELADPHGTIGTGLFCGDWLTPADLLCGRGGGPPLAVSVPDGSFRELSGSRGAIPTVIRDT